jgi:ABC-type transport system involved in cytochrome c biogenesis permease subunit
MVSDDRPFSKIKSKLIVALGPTSARAMWGDMSKALIMRRLEAKIIPISWGLLFFRAFIGNYQLSPRLNGERNICGYDLL